MSFTPAFGVPFVDPFTEVLSSGAALWSPAQIATVAWYDADDAATITESGGLVSAWADKSGNARTCSQGAGTNQPTYSLGNIQFGANDFFTMSALPTTYLLFMVGTPSASTAHRVPLSKNNGTHTMIIAITTSLLGSWQGSLKSSGYTWSPSSTDLVGVDCTLANIAMSLNAAAFVSTTATTVSREATFIGGANGALGFGGIKEMVFIPTSTSSGNKQKIEGYLAWKWGIQAKLPSGHPYEIYAP